MRKESRRFKAHGSGVKTLDAMGSMHGFGIAPAHRTAQRGSAAGQPGNDLLCTIRIVRSVGSSWGGTLGENRKESLLDFEGRLKQLVDETENWGVSGVIGRLLLSPPEITWSGTQDMAARCGVFSRVTSIALRAERESTWRC